MAERFSISLPPDLNEDFERLRQILGLSRSDAIRKAMKLFLNQEQDFIQESYEGNVLGVITYLESSHVHGHPQENPQIPHKHGDIEHVHERPDSYYFPVEQIEFVRLNEVQHDFLDVIISTTHIHVGADKCMLIIAVRGLHDRVKNLYMRLAGFKTIGNLHFSLAEKY